MTWRSVDRLVEGPLVGGGELRIVVVHTAVVVMTEIRCVDTGGIPDFLSPSKVLIIYCFYHNSPPRNIALYFMFSFLLIKAFAKMVDSPHYSSSSSFRVPC